MSRQVIILGAGGHARVTVDTLLAAGRVVLGFVDPGLPKGSLGPAGLPVLGGDEVLEELDRSALELANGLGAIKSTDLRDRVFRHGKALGFSFVVLVHPSAVIGLEVSLGEGAQVMAGCVIQYGAVIGANSIVNTKASVDHDCRVGESVHIAPGAILSGSVTVGDGAYIGSGAVVIQGIAIGARALVAAGAVVYRDLPNGSRLIPGRRGVE